MPQRFENFTTVATKDLETTGEATESSYTRQWHRKIKNGLKFIENNATWRKTALPSGKTAIPREMMLKRKRDEKGHVCRFPAHLVVQMFLQEEDVNYSETFAPVIFNVSAVTSFGKDCVEWVAHSSCGHF